MRRSALALSLCSLALSVCAPSAPAAASGKQGRATPSAPCTGLYPAVFDDFEYAAEPDAASDPIDHRAGHLFGANGWVRCAGAEPAVYSTRAWYRNFATAGEPDWIDDRGRIESQPASAGGSGTLAFVLESGYPAMVGGEHDPNIMSGFQTREGTYAARVRLGAVQPRRHVNQAFYAIIDPNPDSTVAEMDFEWNRDDWWTPRGSDSYAMNVTNHGLVPRPRTSAGAALKCYGGSQRQVDCSGLADRYVTAVMRHHGSAVSYEMFGDGGGAPGGAPVYGGSAAGVPLALTTHAPRALMRVVLGTGVFRPKAPAVAVPTSRRHAFHVDWFYYSPNTDVSRAQIEAEVVGFRAAGQPRVNTTGLRLCSAEAGAVQAPGVPCR